MNIIQRMVLMILVGVFVMAVPSYSETKPALLTCAHCGSQAITLAEPAAELAAQENVTAGSDAVQKTVVATHVNAEGQVSVKTATQEIGVVQFQPADTLAADQKPADAQQSTALWSVSTLGKAVLSTPGKVLLGLAAGYVLYSFARSFSKKEHTRTVSFDDED